MIHLTTLYFYCIERELQRGITKNDVTAYFKKQMTKHDELIILSFNTDVWRVVEQLDLMTLQEYFILYENNRKHSNLPTKKGKPQENAQEY